MGKVVDVYINPNGSQVVARYIQKARDIVSWSQGYQRGIGGYLMDAVRQRKAAEKLTAYYQALAELGVGAKFAEVMAKVKERQKQLLRASAVGASAEQVQLAVVR